MTDITFRHAQASDLPTIISMLADDDLGAKREDASLPVNQKYRTAFEAIDKDPNQYLAVVEQAEEIIGCLQLTFIPGLSRLGMWRGQIESVRIASSHRGSGLGSQMFEWAIAECRNRGCELVQLTTDKARPDALKFYGKLGFEASHEGMKLSLD
ncbi:GNAT family N-acetyltransferase [Kiloniella majae]|uniref:GNAT family N-acetyltransferase n=1 Tax=Kiloniella majae TaxID=1938558 RepID=UPI000A277287|nr:GNAT family N-acetyltransferase [Kiloniella majae]